MARRRLPAETEREWWALLKSKDKTFIRSIKDWKDALADPKRNPLRSCDPAAVRHFTKNLKFKNGGLAHADYSKVVTKLTYLQFKRLWGRFGLGMGLFEDHNNYKCESRGTCTPSQLDICTSNC
jgi:hypothetical protein